MPDSSLFGRVTLDSSVLLGTKQPEFIAACDLGYYRGYWSSWIVAEFARIRTEWIVLRAARELTDRSDAARRLERSRSRVNEAVAEFSRVLTLVDYTAAPDADLSWLHDQDDLPVIQTALVAGVPGTLVTDNSRDFPVGEVRIGITIVTGIGFLDALYHEYPDARLAVADYLNQRERDQTVR